jgi:dTDP-4-amino-4,6-dideoxygalactose transaminase
MNELQAVLGTSQMERLDEFVAWRHTLQGRYDSLLNGLPIIKPYQDKYSYSSLHLYPIQIDLGKVRKSREQIFNALREQNIGVNIHYMPIHTQQYYSQFGFKMGDYPNSEKYYDSAISLPIYSKLDFALQDQIINSIKEIIS